MKYLKRSLLSLACILAVIIPAFCQIPVPRTAYLHMKGLMDKETPLTFNLVKLGDSIYCDYSLDGQNPIVTKNTGDELPVLCGKADPSGKFTLHLPFHAGKPFLKGQITGQKLTGTLVTEDGKNHVVELSEAYPSGTAALVASYLKESKPLVQKPKAPEAKIQMALMLPQESGNFIISDTLKKIMAEKFTSKPYHRETPEELLAGLKRGFFNTYISSNEQLYKTNPNGMNFTWESLKFMHVLQNGSNIFSIYIINYAFTGGAHGLETYEACNVDLVTGKEITTSQLFRDGSQDALKERLTSKLKSTYSLNPEKKLTDAGFFVDEIKPGEQYYITDKGIGFIYNHYDIAPYSSGIFFIFLSWDEIKDLLRPDARVRQLIQ